jgi:hypothetical protein
MARGQGTINVKFLADLADLKKGLKEGGDQVGGFGDNMKKMAGNVVGAIGALGVADFLKDATHAAAEDEASQAKLAKSLETSIGAWDGQVKSIEKWITKAQFTKGFADDELRTAFAGLTEVTHSTAESQNLMSVAMDLARAKGIPLAQAADILAKAHEGNTKAVKAQLPELGALIADNASADEIIAKVAGTVKGQADTFAKSAAGGQEIFHQKLGELTETIGTKLLPIMITLTDWLVKIIDFFSGLPGPVQAGIVVVVGIAAALVGLNSVLGIATAAAAAFGISLDVALGPIALVVLAIAAIGIAIYALVRNWDTVKEAISKGVGAVLGWFKDLGSNIANLAKGLFEPIWGALKSVLNRAIDLLNLYIKAVTAPIGVLNKIPGVKSIIPDIPEIPHLASGGTFSGAAVVGERGPELLVGSGRVVPNSQLGGITINVSGALDPVTVARQIQSLLLEEKRRSGALGLA